MRTPPLGSRCCHAGRMDKSRIGPGLFGSGYLPPDVLVGAYRYGCPGVLCGASGALRSRSIWSRLRRRVPSRTLRRCVAIEASPNRSASSTSRSSLSESRRRCGMAEPLFPLAEMYRGTSFWSPDAQSLASLETREDSCFTIQGAFGLCRGGRVLRGEAPTFLRSLLPACALPFWAPSCRAGAGSAGAGPTLG